ncbi:type IX secretion system PorP/SprF family membrane protein [Chitinophaga japonensis]|uniref:Type IX secretion system PorP/SprF family membrane protein n=2 Tax=Chitinophaga japonensis TaxID=104662 RepID=A0A562SSD0_CHIJA|nr:type IX secretion system PorP/SprF family membrane protein [Chitinophaga japonensis]
MIKWYIVLLLLTCANAQAQQNVQFSQYAFNGLSVNPAYAGYKDAWYVNSIYRQQWTGFPGAPRTAGISADGPVRMRNNGARVALGGQFMADMQGPQQSFAIWGSYAYRIPLDADNTRRLCLGIGLGVTQYRLDGQALQYLDVDDPVFPGGGVNAMAPDARFGIYYHTPAFFLSLSVLDLFSRYTSSRYSWKGFDYGNIRKTQHLYLSTGCMLPLSAHLQLKPSIMIKDDFKGPSNIDLNAMLMIDRIIWIGGSFRTGVPIWKGLPDNLETANAASAIIEYYASEKLRIGYAYDLNINKLAGTQGGSHEISIGLLFLSKKYSTANPRYF